MYLGCLLEPSFASGRKANLAALLSLLMAQGLAINQRCLNIRKQLAGGHRGPYRRMLDGAWLSLLKALRNGWDAPRMGLSYRCACDASGRILGDATRLQEEVMLEGACKLAYSARTGRAGKEPASNKYGAQQMKEQPKTGPKENKWQKQWKLGAFTVRRIHKEGCTKQKRRMKPQCVFAPLIQVAHAAATAIIGCGSVR